MAHVTPSTLVVEDGTGLTNSNTYIDLAYADQYHANRLHNSAWEGSAATQNAALLWATRILDDEVIWQGTRSNSTQALEWPRIGVVDRNGDLFDNNEIPTFLKEAQAELAYHLIVTDRTILPESQSGQTIKKVNVGSNVGIEFGEFGRKNILPPSVLSIIQEYGEAKGKASYVKLVRA